MRSITLLIIAGITLVTFLVASCSQPAASTTIDNGGKQLIIEVDSAQFRVERVNLGDMNGSIYLLVPVNSTVKTYTDIPEVINFKAGKSSTAIVKIK